MNTNQPYTRDTCSTHKQVPPQLLDHTGQELHHHVTPGPSRPTHQHHSILRKRRRLYKEEENRKRTERFCGKAHTATKTKTTAATADGLMGAPP